MKKDIINELEKLKIELTIIIKNDIQIKSNIANYEKLKINSEDENVKIIVINTIVIILSILMNNALNFCLLVLANTHYYYSIYKNNEYLNTIIDKEKKKLTNNKDRYKQALNLYNNLVSKLDKKNYIEEEFLNIVVDIYNNNSEINLEYEKLESLNFSKKLNTNKVNLRSK